MKTEPARLQVSRVNIASAGRPRVEIGDIVAGPGTVFCVLEDLLVVLERACPGAALTGPFRVEAAAEAALLATLEAELIEGSSHLDHAALWTTVDLLVRRLAGPLDFLPAEALATASCPVLTWDEANADIC
jgi:hypothetical protein